MGDVCNALPLALHEFQQDNNVTFYIAKEFASILDGVSYCEREVWDGHYSECLPAAEHAEKSGKFDKVLICQVYGTSIERQTDSFAKEAWRAVGKLHLWGKLPLVFDNRNSHRELKLVERLTDSKESEFPEVGPGFPIVLVSTSGKSSPFPYAKELFETLRPLLDHIAIIDISNLQCERFYDLLSLMEIATCLITTDSGPLHLANAVPTLPVIGLITDRPDYWHGSPPQPNHVLRIRYGEYGSPKSDQRLIDTLMQLASKEKIERRIIHAWNDYPYRREDAAYRHGIARASWDSEYKKGRWISAMVCDAQLTRNGNSIGEQKPLPFVNDIINIACELAQPDDLIVLTNDDTIFLDGLTERLLSTTPPFWSSRWEHAKVQSKLNAEAIKHHSWKHVGADIFVFTKRWWMEFGSEFPDMLVAREAWDLVLRCLINLTGGHEEDALCAHIIHDPEWHSSEHRESVSNLFNRDSARKFFREHNMKWPNV